MPDEILHSFLHQRVLITVGDITRQDVDAVVNAANSTLLGGGGVDGAIHERGGPRILQECQEIRRTRYPDGLPTGEAVMTTGGLLAARYVIHTVGPVWGEHDGEESALLLAACYRNSLSLATRSGLATVAFPSISTGVYNYPRDKAAAVASRAIEQFLASDQSLGAVWLVFFTKDDAKTFMVHHNFGSIV